MTVEELIDKHRDKRDLHITRVMCSWVVVSGGKVIDVDRSRQLDHCPLQRWFSDAPVEEYIGEKIKEFGHFTADREIVRDSIDVPYGTSEMLMCALRKGVLDCAVTVCDGVGTVVTDNPKVIQGIGARMNGLFHTSPIPAVLEGLREHGCRVFDDARIDQVRGLRTAAELGFRRIGLTVNICRGDSFSELRAVERETDVSLVIAGICSTGAGPDRAGEAIEHSDIAWSCASRHMREGSGDARLQLTLGIPVFVYTDSGLEFLAAYSDEEGGELIRGLDPKKRYLVSGGKPGTKIRLGKNALYLAEAVLPVVGKHAPKPLR